MDCPNCGQPVDATAIYCGNCGHPLQQAQTNPVAAVTSPIASVISQTSTTSQEFEAFGHLATGGAATAVPSYAIDTTHTHNHLKVILSMVLGLLGIAGAFFIPLLGIAFGITGIILATTATHASGRWLKICALFASIVALLCGLAVWAYIASNNPRLHPAAAQKAAVANSSANAVTSLNLSTPCYSITFPEQLNVENTGGSCVMDAFNGSSLEASSNVYKVLATTSTTITSVNFSAIAKKALENDVAENLPGFTITSEGGGTFASSQAYFINAADSTSDVAVEEGAVMHSSAAGPELYILVHITFGTSANLSGLENNWQWK
jgi:hypothetical protein